MKPIGTSWLALLAVGPALLALQPALAHAGPILPPGFILEVVADSLDFPGAVAIAPPPDGRIFYAETFAGRLRVIENGTLSPVSFLEVSDLAGGATQGLLGLVLDPDFAANGNLYVYASSAVHGDNRVVRYTDDGLGAAVDPVVILGGIPTAEQHNGGAIEFAPDGTLLIQTGENFDGPLAQDLGSLAGKILRIQPDGGIPADNPFVGVPGAREEIFSLGHRNGFGLAPDRLHPGPLRVYVSENGPEVEDELNVAVSGANFGWPLERGHGGPPLYVDPIHVWATPVAPTGIAQYAGSAYPEPYEGSLLVGHFNAPLRISTIERFALDPSGAAVEGVYTFMTGDLGPSGFILDVLEGPDGLVYFTTGDALYRVTYDLRDADADGCADEMDSAPQVASADEDGDGYGADCDCADGDANVNPGMPETPGNGVDDDC
ncbi:MAG: PQQ-dependent sugar dehydrogenase, partial [Myxococcales bacterium]|nr:PQQ-dependent sugar dehydrogenase [Myxococcales bacterium]